MSYRERTKQTAARTKKRYRNTKRTTKAVMGAGVAGMVALALTLIPDKLEIDIPNLIIPPTDIKVDYVLGTLDIAQKGDWYDLRKIVVDIPGPGLSTGDIADAIIGTITATFDATLGALVDWIVGTIQSIIDTFVGAILGIPEYIGDLIKQVLGGLGDAIVNFIGGLFAPFGEFLMMGFIVTVAGVLVFFLGDNLIAAVSGGESKAAAHGGYAAMVRANPSRVGIGLLMIVVGLGVVGLGIADLAIPDPVPFVDEVLLIGGGGFLVEQGINQTVEGLEAE